MNRSTLIIATAVLSVSCGSEPPRVRIPPAPASAPPAADSARAPAPPLASSGYSGHGAQSISPELLAKFAHKPLPAEVSRRIQAMLDVRAPSLGRVSNDGKTLYFNWSVTGTWQVWRIDGPQRFPVQLTGGEDATRLAGLTPDGKKLLVSRDRKGEENPGLYLLDPAGGSLEVIQHKPGVQTRYQFTTDDGKYVYYAANDVKKDSYAIYRWDLASRSAELVVGEDGLWNVDDHRSDGKLLLGKATGSATREYYEFDPATRTITPLLGKGEREEYRAVYGPKAGELIVLTPKLGEYRRLYRFRGGVMTPVSPEVKMDVSSLSIDRAHRRVYTTVNDGGYTRLKVLDAESMKEAAVPAFKGADHVIHGAASHDGRYVALGSSSSRSPLNSYVYDWTTGKLTEWVLPSAPEVDTKRFAVAALEHYPARDGTPIPMFVRRPEQCRTEPCPVIVHFHGGPEGQSLPGFSTYAQIFVDAGFVFMEPNVRGSDGYGKAWFHADDGAGRLKIITDIEDCALHVRKTQARGGRAPKIGILGGSYGGYSVLMGMTMFAGAYDAGVSHVGISNLVTFLANTAPYRRMLRATEYGDPDRDRDTLVKLSPITYIDKVKGPLLLMQGATDPRVPVGEAVQMHDALQARGVPVGLIVFPDEGHGSQKRDNKVIEIGSALEFFEKHLRP